LLATTIPRFGSSNAFVIAAMMTTTEKENISTMLSRQQTQLDVFFRPKSVQ